LVDTKEVIMVKKSLILKQIIFVTLFFLVLMCSPFVLLDHQTSAEDRWSQIPKTSRQSGKEGYLGVTVQDWVGGKYANGTGECRGVMIVNVIPGSPADKAGLKEKDVIVKYNEKEVKNATELINLISNTPVGAKVKIDAYRSTFFPTPWGKGWMGKEQTFLVLIGEKPEHLKVEAPQPEKKELEEVKQEKSAQQELALIEYIRIGNTLHEYYDNVRRYIGVKAGGLYDFLLSEFLSDKNAAARFAAKLAAHDIGLRSKYWRELEDRLEAKYYRATKGRYSYIDARKKIDKVIEYIGIDEYETDEKKMRKILDFVNVNDFVHYEEDFNQVVNFPLETLTLKSGDCDDFSILVAALFKRVGINSAIAFFKSRTGREGHAMVLFQSKESLPFYSYNDLTQFDLEWGKWYLIEPQKRFDGQNDLSLVNKWIIESAASVSQVSQK